LTKTTRRYRDEDRSLDLYLREIGETPLINAAEEVELAKRIRKGDQKALEKLTKANLRFVVSVAKQYQNQGMSLPDLINEGNLGLIKAARRFDETRGFKFISYAVWWIRQSILQALAEQSRIIRLPLNQVGSLSKVNKASSKLEQLPFTIVQRRTVLCPAVTPVTVEIAEFGVVIAPGPLIMVHVPVPTEAAFPASVKLDVAH